MTVMNYFNPYLENENLEFYNNVKSFARDRIYPGVEERDEKSIWSEKLWKEMGKMGLNGIAIPEEFGGQGANCFQCCLASEAFSIGSVDGGLGLAWGAHTIIGTLPIVIFGTEEQKKKYLPKLATGEWIAGLGLTEPGSGSDAAGLLSKAIDRGDHFLVNGSKMFITNGPIGDVFICMIRTKDGESRGPLGISAMIIERGMKGFSVGKVLKKLGMHTSTTSELIFEDMIVPKQNLLGPLHSGFMRIGRATLEWERTVLVSATAGMSEFVLEKSLRYATERHQFGKPILEFYAIQEKIAKNWIFLQASRRYIYYVAKTKDKGEVLPLQASILKLITTESGEEIAHEGVQIHGGYGYMREYHMERIYRDVKLGTIGAGSSEVMRSIVFSTYPGFTKFRASLSFMLEDFRGDELEERYGKSLSGELELIDAIEKLLIEIDVFKKKDSHQALEFAISDLIMVYSILKQGLWDTGFSSGYYSIQDKKRDLVLLSFFLVTKYMKSIYYIKSLSPQKVKNVVEAYYNLTDVKEHIDDCINFLKKGLE